MEKIKMVQALSEKCFKEVNIIDSLGGEFVIEDNGNYFTVEIKPHAYQGQLSPQILEHFKVMREFLQVKEESRKNKS